MRSSSPVRGIPLFVRNFSIFSGRITVKSLFIKKAPLWLLTVAVGSVAVIAGFIGNLNASDEDRTWATTEYLMIRDLALDTTNDNLVVIGRPENDATAFTTGSINLGGGVFGPLCASKCNANPCGSGDIANDTIFPAQSYYGSFTIAVSTNNSLEGRIPKSTYIKGTGYTNPGKKMTAINLVTDANGVNSACYFLDNGETWTFRKYRVTMD
jgi:hypothetical protein